MSWKLTNDLKPKEIALYYALLYCANKSFWQQEFSAQMPILMQLSGIKDKASFFRARNIIVDKKLIDYKEHRLDHTGTYVLNELLPAERTEEKKTEEKKIEEKKTDEKKPTVLDTVLPTKSATRIYNINNNNNLINTEDIKREDNTHARGQFQNVFLTDEEVQKLRTSFGEQTLDAIERLSEYMESTGRKYKNHYATLCTWLHNDTKKQTLSNTIKATKATGNKYESSLDAILKFANQD